MARSSSSLRAQSPASARFRRRPAASWSELLQWAQRARVRLRLARLDDRGAHAELIQEGETFLHTRRGNWQLHALLCRAHGNMGEWSACVRHGRRVLALHSAHAATAALLLTAYRHLGRPDRGVAFGNHWMKRHGWDGTVCRLVALLHDDVGQLDLALAVARSGIRHHAADLRLVSVAAYLIAKKEGASAALAFAAPHRVAFESDAYCLGMLGDGLMAAGAADRAENIYSTLLQRHPGHGETFAKLLNARIAQRQLDEVVAAAEAWQEHHPLSAAIANEVGRAQLELGHPELALGWFRRAHELAPQNQRYAGNFGVALGLAERHHECIDFCERRLADDPVADRLKLLSAIAIAYTELGEHGAALRYYQQAYDEFPSDSTAQANLLVGYNWLGRYRDSTTLARHLPPALMERCTPRFLNELAWAQHRLGAYPDEAATLRLWHERAPDDSDLVRAYLRCFNAQGLAVEAVAWVRQWLVTHPSSAWGWRHLAEHHHQNQQTAEELDAMENACHAAPDDSSLADFKLVVLRRLRRAREAYHFGAQWAVAHPERVTPPLLNRIGLAADDQEDWAASERWYRRAHEAQPLEPTWCGNLMRALILLGRPVEACAIGRGWIERNRPDAYVSGKLAWAYREMKQREKESETLQAALNHQPRDEAIAYELFNSLLDQHRTAEAGQLLMHLAREGVSQGRFHNNWGNHLRDLHRFDEAESAYRTGLAIDPDNQTLAGNLTSLLVTNGRGAEAIAWSEGWLQRRPDDMYVRRQLAHAYYEATAYAAAEAQYRTVLEFDPESLAVAGRLIACLRLIGRNEEALVVGAKWLQGRSGDAFLLTELGIAARRLHRGSEALAYFEQALAKNPNWPSAAYWKLETLSLLGRTGDGIAFGRQWSERHDTSADFINELAILLDRAGHLDQAEEMFQRAMTADPQDATLAGNAVEIVARQGRHVEAIQIGQRAIGEAPPNAYLLRRLAEAYSKNDEHDAALELLQRADELAPDDFHIACSFLRIADTSGETDGGIDFGHQWLSREGNEDCALVWSWYARLLFHGDENAEAYAAISRARELEPTNIRHVRLLFSFLLSDAQYLRLTEEFSALDHEWQQDVTLLQRASKAFFELGVMAEADALGRRALELHPSDGSVVAWVASMRRHRGETLEAAALLDRWTRAHGPEPHVAVAQAQLSLDSDRYVEALRAAEAALAVDPAAEEAFVVQIRALRALGRSNRARALLHHWIEHHRSTGPISRLLEEIDEDCRENP